MAGFFGGTVREGVAAEAKGFEEVGGWHGAAAAAAAVLLLLLLPVVVILTLLRLLGYRGAWVLRTR
jgi:hypothetical protein